MAKKSATKSKPKKRTAKAPAAKAKKPAKTVAKKMSAAKAKKAAPPKKAGKAAKVAKKNAAKKAARPVASKPAARAKTLPKKAATKVVPPAKKAAAPKKPTPAAKKPASPKKPAPIHRRDGAGHLDPEYAAALLAQSGHHDDEGRAFLGGKSRTNDDLAEELGEEFVQSATSGEAEGEESLNRYVEEESGGPFVGSTAGTEFAEGTDASNPASAEREPFPKT
jgi:hypothetical protein